jgi:hypothetical protein
VNGALVGIVTTVLVGLIAFTADYIASTRVQDVELVKVLYERVGTLEGQYRKVALANQAQAASITKLTIQLATKYEPDQAVKEYIENMPFPAWVKVTQGDTDSPEFIMWHLNDKYERVFSVPKERYIGKTDFDIWPKAIALGFYENDLEVLHSLTSNCADERITYTPTGLRIEGTTEHAQICKWPTTIGGKKAVAGQLMPHAPCEELCGDD